MNVNQDTGVVETPGRSPRFTLWVAFLLFSTICLSSSIGEKSEFNENSANANWAVTCSAITFTVTLVITGFHLSPLFSGCIVGTKVEGIVIFILAVFWTSIVAVISNASNGLAINPDMDNTIANGNLYYFSWAGFVTSILLAVAYLRAVFGVDVASEFHGRAARLTVWAGILAAHLVVMGSSANILDKDCVPKTKSDAYCSRTIYGIALGCIGTIFSLAIISMKIVFSGCPFLIELILACQLCVLNIFGVAFLTAADGPAAPIGNLYYFSWFAFILSILVVSKCYEDYKSSATTNDDSTNNNSNDEEKPAEFPVETLDDV